MSERRLVTRFADDMARELDLNWHKHGWQSMTTQQLLERAQHEMKELAREVRKKKRSFEDIRSEAADVGNFLAMLVWNACKEEKEKR